MALCSYVCSGKWLRKLLTDFNISSSSTSFYEENYVCLALIENPVNKMRVNHIDLKLNL